MYDIVVLGGGPGGYVAAIRAAQLGAKVALIEKDKIGGVCLNRGCIPTKTLLRSASLFCDIRNAAEFGVDVANFSINYKRMMERKNNIVERLTKGINWLIKFHNIDVIKGCGDILTNNSVIVGKDVIEASNIIVAVGSSPAVIPINGANDASVITSDNIFSLEKIPDSLTIIGGGIIGTEIASFFSSIGCYVSIIEMEDRIVPMMDADISKGLLNMLVKQGVNIITDAKVESINKGKVKYIKKGVCSELISEKILISAGRTSNAIHLSLDKIGIVHKKGFILTDERMKTNIHNIYAIGDVNGKYMLAHVASAEAIVAVENIMGLNRKLNYEVIPQCIYTFPEAASVGITEEEAVKKGLKIKVSSFPVSANGKALAEGCDYGFVKMIADCDYGQILGVHVIAPHASDLIAQCALAMNAELTVDEIIDTIFPHPAISEILLEAACGLESRSIHFISQ